MEDLQETMKRVEERKGKEGEEEIREKKMGRRIKKLEWNSEKRDRE